MSSTRRVVITGQGLVSPLGLSPDAVWQALLARRSAVAPISNVGASSLPTTFAAEAREFTGAIDDFGALGPEQKKAIRKGLKLMCRESQMGVAAAQRAIDDSGILKNGFDPELGGVIFGSDYMLTMPDDFVAGVQHCMDENHKFDFERWGVEGLTQVTPLWLLKYLPNMPASHVAIYNDLRGPNNSITLREASSNLAVGEAFRTIARGSADFMVAGATGTRIHPVKMVHAITQEEVAGGDIEPARASRPFDRDRTGMVLGEGAGVIVLEELNAAKRRGAKIIGEIVGTSSSAVSDRHGVGQRRTALVNAMRAALRDAGLQPRDIGHIHAHGLSTHSSDTEEAAAIHDVFGIYADKVPVVAAKSYFGNLGAASGVIELMISLLALQHGHLFATLNYENPDPDCQLQVVTSDSVPAGKCVLNLSVTPQGQAAALIAGIYA